MARVKKRQFAGSLSHGDRSGRCEKGRPTGLAAQERDTSRQVWAHGGVVWRLRDEPLILDPYVDALDRSAWVLARMLLVPIARSGDPL
jgi:hypothetical protein